MDDSTNVILQFIKDWFFLISAFIAFIAGYVRLKVRMDSMRDRIDRQDKRMDRMEDSINENMKDVQVDLKTILRMLADK